MLKNYYVFAIVLAVAIATLNWLYARTLENDEKASKTFYKTLAAGLAGGLALAWFVSRPEDVLPHTEPFPE